MATPVETTTTITRTTRVEGADQLRASLTNVAEEIAKVRDRAREEATSLDKIRSMLDVGSLSNLVKVIEELETRVATLQTNSTNAMDEVARAQAELRQEQERLQKLWEAYKAQEDELLRVKRDYPLVEEKLFERERTIETLRREVTRLEAFQRYKSDAEAAALENRKLRQEVEHQNGEIRRVTRQLEELEGEARGLRELAPSRTRVAELEASLEEERERLAKLYKVYEDLDGDNKALKAQLKKWDEWFHRFQPAFEGAASSVGGAPHSH